MPTAIIIGASSGLGHEIALTYLRRGYRLGLAARRVDLLSPLVDEAPQRVSAIRLDVTADDATSQLQALIDMVGPDIDLFIHCAGIGFANPQLDADRDTAIVDTNCLGFTRIINHMFNYFAHTGRKGQIAAITSVAGTRGIGIAASYSASKRFQSEYLTALRQLAHHHRLPITITDIRPGFIDTPLLDAGKKYPMIMNPRQATALIVKTIDRRRNRRTINRRWALLVAAWRCIPSCIWQRMRLHLSQKGRIK